MAAGFVFCPAAAGGTGHCPARRQQVEPGTARPGGSRWNRALPGPALAPPAGSICVGNADSQSAGKPADSKKPAALIYGGWFRVLSGGSRWNRALPGPAAASGTGHCPARRQQVAVGPADRNSCGVITPSFLQTKNPEALIYGRRIRLAGASTACRLSLPAASGSGHCPACFCARRRHF